MNIYSQIQKLRQVFCG